jgi:hypothetical protein
MNELDAIRDTLAAAEDAHADEHGAPDARDFPPNQHYCGLCYALVEADADDLLVVRL